jgi:hypothetical protein
VATFGLNLVFKLSGVTMGLLQTADLNRWLFGYCANKSELILCLTVESINRVLIARRCLLFGHMLKYSVYLKRDTSLETYDLF